jgi:hypothetical protein
MNLAKITQFKVKRKAHKPCDCLTCWNSQNGICFVFNVKVDSYYMMLCRQGGFYKKLRSKNGNNSKS